MKEMEIGGSKGHNVNVTLHRRNRLGASGLLAVLFVLMLACFCAGVVNESDESEALNPGTYTAGELVLSYSSFYEWTITGFTSEELEKSEHDIVLGNTVTVQGQNVTPTKINLSANSRGLHYTNLTIGPAIREISSSSFSTSVIDNLFFDSPGSFSSAPPFTGAKIGTITIGNNVQTIYSNMFKDLKNEAGNPTVIRILDTVENPSTLTYIQQGAFKGTYIDFDIPSTVTSIGQWAFDSCSGANRLTIPEGITSLSNNWIFQNYRDLTHIVIPSSLTTIGSSTFEGSTITTVTLNGNSGLTNAKLPNTVKNLVLSDTTTELRTNYFVSTVTLETLYAGASIGNDLVTYIISHPEVRVTISPSNPNFTADNGFIYSLDDGNPDVLISYTGNEAEPIIPSGITAIAPNAFANNSTMTKVTIPGTVTSIGAKAFYNCTALKKVAVEKMTDSSAVTSIGAQAFDTGFSKTLVFCTVIYFDGDETDFVTNVDAQKTMWTNSFGSSKVNIPGRNYELADFDSDEFKAAHPEYDVGTNYWVFEEGDMLTISAGTSTDMDPNAPWADLKPYVKRLIFENDLTSVNVKGTSGFYNLEHLDYCANLSNTAGFSYDSPLSPNHLGSTGIFAGNGKDTPTGYYLNIVGNITNIPHCFLNATDNKVREIYINTGDAPTTIGYNGFINLDYTTNITINKLNGTSFLSTFET